MSGHATPSLAQHYATARSEVTSRVLTLPRTDRDGRMRAVVDAIWTHLHMAGISWVGFYLPSGGDPNATELLLGPSRNTPACSPIGLHGVCGQCFLSREERIVPDVRDLGSAYVACDPRDRSELVLPLVSADGRCSGVVDLDSHSVGRFTDADAAGVRAILVAAGLLD